MKIRRNKEGGDKVAKNQEIVVDNLIKVYLHLNRQRSGIGQFLMGRLLIKRECVC